MAKGNEIVVHVFLTGAERRQAMRGGRMAVRRPVHPQPGLTTHAYQHPTQGWWVFGDNSGRVYANPKPHADGLELRDVRVTAEEMAESRWHWVVEFDAVPEQVMATP